MTKAGDPHRGHGTDRKLEHLLAVHCQVGIGALQEGGGGGRAAAARLCCDAQHATWVCTCKFELHMQPAYRRSAAWLYAFAHQAAVHTGPAHKGLGKRSRHSSAGKAHLVTGMSVAQRLHARAAVCAVEVPHAVAICGAGRCAADADSARQHTAFTGATKRSHIIT